MAGHPPEVTSLDGEGDGLLGEYLACSEAALALAAPLSSTEPPTPR
ncbi:MAG: hypothetical protein J2P15_01605 [Micromonosporaceae bacterium]|nr:hypothetical protein [Micromonosporaceae bacterium]